MTAAQIEEIFTYHQPFGSQAGRYEELRGMAKNLAHAINVLCPESREKSLAITKLQECVQMANASIAINEEPGNEVVSKRFQQALDAASEVG